MGLLDRSIAGGVMILAVVVIRALGANRLPKGVFTVLWAMALVRLLTPVSVSSPVSVYVWLTPRMEAVQTGPDRTEPVAEPAASGGTERHVPENAVPAQTQSRTRDMGARMADVPWGTLLWAAGALSCAGVFTESGLRVRRRFREAVDVEDNFVRRWQDDHPLRRRVSVRLSGRVKAPMTYGILRPVILLNADTDWKDEKTLGYILAHEYGHIRRLDGLKKLVLAAAACLHWFNPLVWVMLALANRDMEMACDGYVVRNAPGDSRADYARTLIRMEEVKSGLSPLVSHFSANAMEERIVSIMKYKKLTAWTVVASLFLTLGVTAVFATSAPEPAGEPVPYDWGEAVALFPMTEEGLESLCPEDDIQWWTAEDFAAWVKEQKPLLEAAVGCEARSGTVAGIWTEERSEKILAAYEDIVAALEAGTGKLSRTVGGSGQAVVAVGFDWPLDTGGGNTLRGYDVEALLWGPEDDWPEGVTAHTYSVELEPGGMQVDLGPSQTLAGLFKTIHACFRCLVRAGTVDSGQANDILQDWWTIHQDGELPDRYALGAGRETDGAVLAAEPTPDPTPLKTGPALTLAPMETEPTPTPAPVEVEPTPEPTPLAILAGQSGPEAEKLWYGDLKPQYVWDLTGNAGVVREVNPAEEADYLLDVKPYGCRTPVNVEYLDSVQSVSSLLQPGQEVLVGQSQGTYNTLVIFRDDGQVVMGCRSLDGDEENPYGGHVMDVTAGSFHTGSNGWTVEGGTAFYVRNEADGPIRFDGFLYETK